MRRQKYIARSNNSMNKYLALIGAAIGAIILCLALTSGQSQSVQKTESVVEEKESTLVVAMAMSSSRPGCEKTGCYVPSVMSINSGDTITWVNQDRGLHTVTTGYYDTPDGMVESAQIAPEDKFSFTFDTPGEFHYYCRLHPWMEGTIIVK